MENIKTKCIPCICNYPLCNIIQYTNEDEKSAVYNLCFTHAKSSSGDVENIFKRIYNIFTKKKYSFCFDILVNSDDVKTLVEFDPNIHVEKLNEDFPDTYAINDIYYVNKGDLGKLNIFNYLYNGAMEIKLLRVMDLEGNITFEYTE